MKFLLCDLESEVNNRIVGVIKELSSFSPQNIYYSFTDADFKVEQNFDFDFVVLNNKINLQNLVRIASDIKKCNVNIEVCILTYESEILESEMIENVKILNLEALENLIKESITKHIHIHSSKDKYIMVNYQHISYKVYEKDIIYFNIDSKRTIVETSKGTYISNKSFKYWKNYYENCENFCQPHYSYIINMNNIFTFNNSSITLVRENEKREVPISRAFKNKFRNKFKKFIIYKNLD